TLNLVRKKKKVEPPTFKGHYAGFVTRLVAFVIDILIVSISIGVMLGTINLILNFFNIDLSSVGYGTDSLSEFANAVIIFLTSFTFTFLVSMTYTMFFWMVAGKTIGKAVMGVRVIGPKGARMTLGRSFKRYIGYWISAIPLFMGYFWVLVNDQRHGWHDVLAGTSVIYDYEAQYTEAGLGRLAQYAPKLEAKMDKKALPSGGTQTVALPSAVEDEQAAPIEE
ncbi:MAG: RDD family protein, partial [Anaerolineae bacterium]|nr:RDD family protein [Anaerolineae bacterium]